MTVAKSSAPRDFVPRVVGGGEKLEGRVPRSRQASWRDFRRAADTRRLRHAHPGEPWRWDYSWDARGVRDDDTRRRAVNFGASGLLLAVIFALPTTALSVGALVTGELSLKLFALPFLAIALGIAAVAARLLARGARLIAGRLKYGRGLALFESFPFRRGETLRLHVEAPPTLPQHAVVTATLRCVQERYVTTSTEEGSTALHCFEVYRDTAPAELIDAGHGVRAIRVTFPIPADAPVTDLASHPCRYWEVDVDAATDGVDYGARFLVPVY